MNIDEIQQRIQDIENDTDKPEGSLSSQGSNEEYLRQKESYLWYKVLESIADGVDNTQELAKEAIQSIYISFDSPPYTFFLLNGDMELHRNRHFFI